MDRDLDKVRKVLKPWKSASDKDKAIFEDYVRRDISLMECLILFRRNNRVHADYDIDVYAFKDWLKSIGYSRRGE